MNSHNKDVTNVLVISYGLQLKLNKKKKNLSVKVLGNKPKNYANNVLADEVINSSLGN